MSSPSLDFYFLILSREWIGETAFWRQHFADASVVDIF